MILKIINKIKKISNKESNRFKANITKLNKHLMVRIRFNKK
jgi:hypothetical protein